MPAKMQTSVKCQIDSCSSEPVAKGLCAKHYMRSKRTGNPNVTRKPGRQRQNEVIWQYVKGQFSEYGWSPRTIDRYVRAYALLQVGGFDSDFNIGIIKAATRSSGSFNVSKFERLVLEALEEALCKIAEREAA
jgi:hypothetical protein